MKLITDIHERESGIPAALADLGMRIEERQLSAGDYLIEGLAVIERKTIADLHQSVQRGRFWAQIGKLRRAERWPYLLIEGPSLYRRSLRDEAVRGLVVAVSDLGVTVYRSESPRDSAFWIRRLALRRAGAPERDRPVYAQRPRRESLISPSEQALTAVPGISTATARALLWRFETLLGVLLASDDELAEVPGVGPKRAARISSLASSTSHSGVSRNGAHRAT